MAFFVVPYVIHFDDTMAYGSHHFLTNFKFQCAGRENLLFSEFLFDVPEFKRDFDSVVLLTHEAYSRNLAPANLGDRLLVLLSVEERTDIGLRFCFRVLRADGEPVSCGYQTILCADRTTGQIVPFPASFAACFDRLANILEAPSGKAFRDRVHQGGKPMRQLFSEPVKDLATRLLRSRGVPASGIVAEPLLAVPDRGTAFLFPGQNSLDLATLRALIRRSPELEGELRAIAAIVTERLGVDCAAFLFASTEEAARESLARNPDLDQIAIYLTGALGAQLFARDGIQPDVMVGHSFGEIAALAAAGAFDLQVGAQIVCERIRALATETSTGRMAAVGLDEVETRRALEAHGLARSCVSGVNHSAQTIVAGPPAELAELEEVLRARGKSVRPLDSRYPFHHPSLGGAAARFEAAIAHFPIRTPAVPVFSPIDGPLDVQNAAQLAAVLASHLVRPFDFARAVRKLQEAGVHHFRECGGLGQLGRIVSKILPASAGIEVDGIGDRLAAAPSIESTEPASVERTEAIAIVSLGCVLPGGARDPEAYWKNVLRGTSGIRSQEGLEDDFFRPEGGPDKTYSLLAGVVNDADVVAPPGIRPSQFEGWARAQKLLAIALGQCLTGLRRRPPAERIRCLLGSTADGIAEYDAALAVDAMWRSTRDEATQQALERAWAVGSSASLAPYPTMSAVVEALLGEGAPTVLLDAACASSLYTLALGVHQLQRGDTDLALAGGVFSPGPGNSCLFAQFRGLSAKASRPFDAGADGVIFGEGAGIIAMKRLADAERDGDEIWAIIRGAGLSSDGKSSSANVPRASGQVLAMDRCYAESGVDPLSVQYVEAHGTSTPAGDMTELDSLARFFGERRSAPLELGSVKALLGHTGWAAGAASVIKLCLSLRAKVLAPQHNFSVPNPRLAELESKGFHVPRTEAVWPVNGQHPRRAATSGFGFGGTNAHILLEEYRKGASTSTRPRLSASPPELSVIAVEGAVPKRAADLATIPLPPSIRLLPDLAEDMDLTQRLALTLVGRIKDTLGDRFTQLRARTATVLGLVAKTERGLEATQRVLADSLARKLTEQGTSAASARAAVEASCRPSGAYTLQGMMPNVTAGRVANVFDLNGPNFIVDAGPRSLYEALHAARLLLSDGCDMVLVGAFESASSTASTEAATMIAVCTPEMAKELELGELCRIRLPAAPASSAPSPGLGVRALFAAVEAARAGRSTTSNLGGSAIEVAALTSEARKLSAAPSFDQDAPVGYFTPVLVPRPIEQKRERWSGKRFLVLAPDMDLANEIEAAFADYDVELQVLTPTAISTNGSGRVRGVDLTDDAAELLQLLAQTPPDRVISVVRFDSASSEREMLERATRGRALLDLLFLVSRSLYARLARGEARVACVCLGAVLEADVLHPATGLYAGFIKSLAREIGPANAGSFSFEDPSLAPALERLAWEWTETPARPLEVVWRNSGRSVRLLAPVPRTTKRARPLDARSVVLATGGARGVTAVLVEALLQEYACTVVVLGRSHVESTPSTYLEASPTELDALETQFYSDERKRDPLAKMPNLRERYARYRAANELHQTLARFARAGGNVVYRACDITSDAQVTAAVDELRRAYGRLDLVVHGAGLQSSKHLDRRRLGELRANLDTKLLGFWNLYEACDAAFQEPVAFHILTSAFSVMGNDGQADYGAANETLDRICAFVSSRRQRAPFASIGWLAWDSIGMTRSSEYRVLGAARGLRGIAAAEGKQLFLDVLESSHGPAINVQLTEGERIYYDLELASAEDRETKETRHIRVDSAKVPCLESHLVRGTPTLPGAWGLDLMLEAAIGEDSEVDFVTIENVEFSRFLRVPAGASQDLRAHVVRDRGGRVHVKLLGDLVHSSGRVLDRDRLYQQATFDFDTPRPDRIGARQTRHSGLRADDPYCRPGGPLELRGPFSCLHDIVITPDERTARFVLSRDDVRAAGNLVPAMLLDAAWRLSAMHAEGVSSAVYAPTRFERIGIQVFSRTHAEGAPLEVTIRAGGPRVEGDNVHCTWVEALNDRGELCLFVESGHARRLN